MTHPLHPLTLGGYRVILADPPWQFDTYSDKGQGKSASQHYGCMTLDDIKALPVADLAHRDGAILFLWCTWPLVAQGVHTDVVRAWGFEPSSGGSWGKVTVEGLPCFGTGYVARDACEPFIIGRRGRMPLGWRKTERNLILAPRREHSRKPEEMRQMIDRALPGSAKADLFSRESRPGWDCWGAEAGKFDEVAA